MPKDLEKGYKGRGHRFEFLINVFDLACNRTKIREEEVELAKKIEVK